MPKYAIAVLVFASLLGCSSGEDMATAEKEVVQFRQLMESEQFAKLYANASDELRKSASEADVTKIFGALSRKLGKVKTADKAGWHVNFHTAGTFVTLGFNTQFEKGPGTEQFVFRVSDGKARLVSYNVNSAALLLN
jgi:hypothetical protein